MIFVPYILILIFKNILELTKNKVLNLLNKRLNFTHKSSKHLLKRLSGR